MKCKKCKQDIPDHARFCPWCGRRLQKDAGEVSVPQPRKLPSGTFYGRLTVAGERVSVSAPTEADYYAKARALKTGLIESKKAAGTTLEKAINNYINDHTNVFSPSTTRAYRSMAKHRFPDYMKKGIDRINWQRMVNDEKGSAKTVANAWSLVAKSVAHAGAPAPSVALPKIPKADRPWLDYEQIQTFLEAVKGKDCELAALLALNGLRRSELLHLTAEDIEDGIIHVRGASVYNDEGKVVEKSTNKTAGSSRDVHICIPRLEELLEGRTGKLVTAAPNSIYFAVNDICKAAGLPEVGVHGLRHSFASLANRMKWDVATTMREGGWSNSQTVLAIYTHLASKDLSADVDRMRTFFMAKNDNKKSNE
jgi:integrase